jgi:YgiT-type zinc finger domain-containing protein
MAKAEKKTMTTKANKQRCAVCDSELEAITITHEEKRGTHIYLFQNVPAKICGECREIWIDEEVLQQIDKLIEYEQHLANLRRKDLLPGLRNDSSIC